MALNPNERIAVEEGIELLLQPLVTAGTLRKVLALGGNPPADVMKAALASRRWAMIEYGGKKGSTEGELSKQRLVVDVVVGVGNDKSLRDRLLGCYDVLKEVEHLLLFQVIGDGYSPLEFLEEQRVEVTDGGIEIWLSRWAVEFLKGAY